MKSIPMLALLGALACASFPFASSAAAQSCTVDADCEAGLVCTSLGTMPCKPCSDPGGDDGELVCPVCDEQEYKACALPECETNADCPSGTVCEMRMEMACPTAPPTPCDSGECSEDLAAPDCQLQMTNQCVPQYVLPCTQASDCGDGFTCEERVSRSCGGASVGTGGAGAAGSGGSGGDGSGDSGAGMAGAGAAPPSDEPLPEPEPKPEPRPEPLPEEPLPTPDPAVPDVSEDCMDEPTSEFMCVLVVTECDVDADCVDGFQCVASAQDDCASMVDGGTGGAGDGSGGTGGSGGDGSGGAGSGAGDGSGDSGGAGEGGESDAPAPEPRAAAPSDSCEPVAAKKYCLPPYHALGGGIGTDAAGGAREDADPVPADGETSSDGSASGEDGDGDDEDEETPALCAVSAPGSRSGNTLPLSLLTIFGIGLWLRRRRAC